MQIVDGSDVNSCAACGKVLLRRNGRSVDAALSFSLATTLLLVPANLCTFLTTSAVGVSRSSVLASSATAMLKDGWPLLAV